MPLSAEAVQLEIAMWKQDRLGTFTSESVCILPGISDSNWVFQCSRMPRVQ